MVVDAYNTLSDREVQHLEISDFYKYWKTNIPIKIILFFWLVCHNKNLTWENLQKRQWHGPSICVICKNPKENIVHLFLKCPYTIEVWKKLAHTIGFPCIRFDNIRACMKWWCSQKTNWRIIPPILFWMIWKWRNRNIFEKSQDRFSLVFYRTISYHTMGFSHDVGPKREPQKLSCPQMQYPDVFFTGQLKEKNVDADADWYFQRSGILGTLECEQWYKYQG